MITLDYISNKCSRYLKTLVYLICKLWFFITDHMQFRKKNIGKIFCLINYSCLGESDHRIYQSCECTNHAHKSTENNVCILNKAKQNIIQNMSTNLTTAGHKYQKSQKHLWLNPVYFFQEHSVPQHQTLQLIERKNTQELFTGLTDSIKYIHSRGKCRVIPPINIMLSQCEPSFTTKKDV